MRVFVSGLAAALALATLAGCQRGSDPAAGSPAVAASHGAYGAATPVAVASAVPIPDVEGWVLDPARAGMIGQPSPDFVLPMSGKTGATASVGETNGNPSILVFFGLWSEDSLAELAHVSALHAAAAQDRDLDVLAIHTPLSGAHISEAFGAYLSLEQGLGDRQISWPVAIDADAKVAAAYGVSSLPAYVLIGPDGDIAARRGSMVGASPDGIKPMLRGAATIRGLHGVQP